MVQHDTLRTDNTSFDKTIEKATSVIVKYPGSRYIDDALFMMGASYYYKGDYSRALEKLDVLCLNYPDSKFYDDALYYKGLSCYKQQKYGQSVITLKEAAVSRHFTRKAMMGLCYVYFQDSNYVALTETAQELLNMGLGAEEKRSIYYLLGEAQFNQKQYLEASVTFNELLKITRIPQDERRLKLKIAESYLELGEYEKCQEFLEGEDDLEFRGILADLHVKRGNIDKAKEIYVDVTMSAVSDFAATTFYKLAEIYREQDSLELAIAYYDSAISRSSLSEHGIQSKKMADVLRRIDVLSKETDNMDRAQFLLAEIYYLDFNEPDRAVDEYEKVYTGYPQSIWAPKALYAHLWIARMVMDNDSLSSALYAILVDRYPRSEYAVSARTLVSDRHDEIE